MTRKERTLKSYPIHYCQRCGEQLLPRTCKDGTLERTNDFKKRKYCSRECYHLTRPEKGLSEKSIYALVARYREDECLICGAGVVDKRGFRLAVHHIDGNRQNNDPLNLATLCNACHGRIHDALGTHKRGYKKTPTELFDENHLNPEDLD